MFFLPRKKNPATEVALFVIGAVAGAAAALLFAPMSGKKMQRKLIGVTDKVVDKVEDFGQSVRRAVNA